MRGVQPVNGSKQRLRGQCVTTASSELVITAYWHRFTSQLNAQNDLKPREFFGYVICFDTLFAFFLLWYVDLLLGNDREVNSYTIAVAR
jgi:hypothetical protein